MHSKYLNSFLNCNIQFLSHLQLQLKELFVRKEFRNNGVGGLLMQKVLDEARHSGCYRVDWNVRDWNVKGINFYKKLGAKFVEDRLSMRIELDGV